MTLLLCLNKELTNIKLNDSPFLMNIFISKDTVSYLDINKERPMAALVMEVLPWAFLYYWI